MRVRWRERVDPLARTQLTNEQYERYIDMVGHGQQLPAVGFAKTLDALYASSRPTKLDYLSLNVYEPFGGPRRDPNDTDRRIKWERYVMDGEVYRTFILAKNDFNADLPVFMGENSLANLQPLDGRLSHVRTAGPESATSRPT